MKRTRVCLRRYFEEYTRYANARYETNSVPPPWTATKSGFTSAIRALPTTPCWAHRPHTLPPTALLLAGAKGVRGWFAGTVFRVKDGDGDGDGVRWVAGDERGRAALSLLSRDRNFMAGKATKAAPARWDGRDNVVDSHCNEQSEGTAGR